MQHPLFCLVRSVHCRGNRFFKIGFLAACAVLANLTSVKAGYDVIHHFGGFADGRHPAGGVVATGSSLYGVTGDGGPFNGGVVYKGNLDGSGFTFVHAFSIAPDTARFPLPVGPLVLSGPTLFGVTTAGGANHNGSVFRVDTDGSGFSDLHSFATSNDGVDPSPGLVQSGSTLYGVTSEGGSPSGNQGTIFRLSADGTGYQILHNFVGGSGDGSYPDGRLIQSGSTLYGVTRWGGSTNSGTLFKINTDGSGFAVLHSFGVGGQSPRGALHQVGNTLYGAASGGGDFNGGVIFSIQTDGTGYTKLHSFKAADDGSGPQGDLLQRGAKLYGTAFDGGAANLGTLFRMNLDGTEFNVLHSFAGGSSDGAYPSGLSLIDSTLYGTTSEGGSLGVGVLFAFAVPEPSSLTLGAAGALVLACWTSKRQARAFRSNRLAA